MTPIILIIEDETPIRSMLRYALEMGDFTVLEAGDAKEAQQIISKQTPDLILMDWMLPQVSGVAFTKQLKQDEITRDIPIIMLTAKAEEDNKVLGLEVGVDDYVVKPFSPRELLARVRAVLRRGPLKQHRKLLEIGQLKIDTDDQRVFIEDTLIELGPLEYRLLYFLATHPDRVYSRDELLTHVWGRESYIDERTVDVHIRRLRKRLKPHGHDKLVQTVHGSGYRFTAKKYDKKT